MADYESDSSGSVVIASDLENETVEEESLYYPRRSQNGPPSINVQNLASIICWKSSENKATEYQKIHVLCFRRLRQLIVSVNGGYYYF